MTGRVETLPQIDIAGHRQTVAVIPNLFAQINRAGTERLVPEMAMDPAKKVNEAILVFQKLAQIRETQLRSSRFWSYDYFQAVAEGPRSRRDFLIRQGVFYGGEYLRCPEDVLPQMEIANFNPDSIKQGPLKTEVEKLMYLMYGEYFGVKNLIAFPNFMDLVVTIADKTHLANRLPLPTPRLKLSLLLKDYIGMTLSEAKRTSGLPLIGIFGPGKGEETVEFIKRGLSLVCIDAHNFQTIESLFKTTFNQAGRKPPEIMIANQNQLDLWEKSDHTPKIFVLPNQDFSKEGVIPDWLIRRCQVTACIYVLHEMANKAILIKNMATVSRGSVIVVDGLPTCEALDNVILPVSDSEMERKGNVAIYQFGKKKGAPITGHDAVVTALLCSVPDQVKNIAAAATTRFSWDARIIGPKIKDPFFYKLQMGLIGRIN